MSNEQVAEVQSAETTFDIRDLRRAPLPKLIDMARELDLNGVGNMGKRDLVFQILKEQASDNGRLWSEGVLEVLPDGFGFLRGAEANYLPGQDDIYVSPSQIRRFDLKTGDTLSGEVRPPNNGERYFALAHIHNINHVEPEEFQRREFYAQLTPLHPDEKFRLEHRDDELSTRLMDLLCPLGKGQRALIVSPPRAGKTVLMQNIAHGISANHPDTMLLVLLIDERPEEVTEMARSVRGEVVSSTFDEPAERHIQVAEMVTEKARRLVEAGHDVVILLDSITRLARAYNTTCPSSGKVLSGGVDANALHKPKRFFGAARNIEEGGSLSIIATALVDTGSRMDEVIFEEFKGTGNSEIVLDRKLADRRVWPAIDVNRSGTRKEELLLGRETLNRVWVLRKVLQPLGPAEAMQLLTERVGKTDSNDKFLQSMNQPE